MEAATAASKTLTVQLDVQAESTKKLKVAADEARAAAASAAVQIQQMGEGLAGIALSIEQAGQALKGMAVVVGQVQEKISDGNKDVADLLKQLDSVAHDTKAEGYVNTIINRLKEGVIGIDEAKRQIQEALQGLERINAQGSGFMGDLNKQATDLLKLLNAIQEQIDKAKDEATQSATGQDEAAQQQSSAGVGGSASGDMGSSSTGFRDGPKSSFGMTQTNEVNADRAASQRLTSSSASLSLGATSAQRLAAQKARLLHQIERKTKR